jgi:hypothetical protein
MLRRTRAEVGPLSHEEAAKVGFSAVAKLVREPVSRCAGPGVVQQGLGARARTGRRSRLQFSVYDRSGVAAADVAIDGGRPRALRRQSDFKRLVKRLRRGPHRLRFRARDGAGNHRTTTRLATLR